jgi:tetratricopeptide repeat protein
MRRTSAIGTADTHDRLDTSRPAVFARPGPNVAITLHNLGLLYIDMQRQADARGLLGEALKIYRDLTSTNPAVYTARIEAVTKLLAEPRASSSSSGEGH